MKQAIAVIPARLHSTRLPGKVLRLVAGKPLIQWVIENVRRTTRLTDVVVACDHEDIKRCAEACGARAFLTRHDHQSGTARIAELAPQLSQDIIVNVQGDEPLVAPEAIEQLVSAVREAQASFSVATACVLKQDVEEYQSPHVVKVVKDQHEFALYFSRAAIPFARNGHAPAFFKHLGLYAYTREFLLQYPALAVSALEDSEQLEQLRILDNGFKIKMVTVETDSIGVDTAEDLQRVATLLESHAPYTQQES